MPFLYSPGISTPLFVLKHKLNMCIEQYFSCEVDVNCRKVHAAQFRNDITQLGCIEALANNHDLLCAILPIHVIILTPPCYDLTLLNARRMEWTPNSSAFLIVTCMKIVKFITQKMDPVGCAPLWLFETTAHMSKPCAERVFKEVGTDLHPICASAFTATYRRRYFAGNVPRLGETAAAVSKRYSGIPLQRFLEGYRTANTVIAPCVTSNVSLQKKPVTIGGSPDNLYITEIESLLGFPKGYTDAANLSVRQREKLLARVVNVPTLHAILAPLKEVFGHGS